MPMATKEEQREYQKRWMAERRQAYLKGKYCVRCGSIDNLHVHHKDRALKVHHCVWSWSEERRSAELSKCEILCRDCHIQHHREDGAFKTFLGRTPTNAKLTSDKVIEILELKKINLSNRKIGIILNIPRQTVDDVISGKSWSWVSKMMAGGLEARRSTVNGEDVGATPTLPASLQISSERGELCETT